MLGFAGLLARFVDLQVIQHRHYQTLAETNRIAIVPIVPNRGVITDRNGVVLARSYSAYTLEVTPSRVRNLDETIDELAEIVDIQPRDRKRFKRLLDETKNLESLPLRTRLSDEEVARFAVNRYRFPGVEIKARLFRQYPFGEIASHVIGYIGRINERDVDRIDNWGETANYKGSDYIGKIGLELFYERELHGTTGVEEVEVDAAGRAVRTLSRTLPTSGNNLRLSLDIQLQEAAEAAFGDAARRAGGDRSRDRRGAGIRVEARLRPQSVRRRHRSGELGRAQRLARQAAAQPPAARRVSAGLDDQAVPGAVGADVGQAHAEQVDFRSRLLSAPGQRAPLPRRQARRARLRRHEQVDRRVLRHLLLHARRRNRHRCHARYLAQFGFGSRTGIDIEGELPGVLPSREWKRERFAGKNIARSSASGTSATRSPPASARATTRSRRCSWRRRSRRSPTTASASGRIS